MLEHCKAAHEFDFVATVKRENLDFYSTIKFVNFIRTNVRNGNTNPVEMRFSAERASDELLTPVLEDDALLFTLDEVVEFEKDGEEDERMENGDVGGQSA